MGGELQVAEFDSRSRAVAGSRPPAAVRRTPSGWLARESVSVLRDRRGPRLLAHPGGVDSIFVGRLIPQTLSARTFPRIVFLNYIMARVMCFGVKLREPTPAVFVQIVDIDTGVGQKCIGSRGSSSVPPRNTGRLSGAIAVSGE